MAFKLQTSARVVDQREGGSTAAAAARATLAPLQRGGRPAKLRQGAAEGRADKQAGSSVADSGGGEGENRGPGQRSKPGVARLQVQGW